MSNRASKQAPTSFAHSVWRVAAAGHRRNKAGRGDGEGVGVGVGGGRKQVKKQL